MLNYLRWLKKTVTKDMFKEIVKATEDYIKFNRVMFGKTTNEDEFVEIAMRTHTAFLRCEVVNV